MFSYNILSLRFLNLHLHKVFLSTRTAVYTPRSVIVQHHYYIHLLLLLLLLLVCYLLACLLSWCVGSRFATALFGGREFHAVECLRLAMVRCRFFRAHHDVK